MKHEKTSDDDITSNKFLRHMTWLFHKISCIHFGAMAIILCFQFQGSGGIRQCVNKQAHGVCPSHTDQRHSLGIGSRITRGVKR